MDAFGEAHKFCEWDVFQTSGMMVNLRRSSPRLLLHALPNKVVAFCLPLDELLDADFRRNLGNLFFRMMERVQADRVSRIGVAVSSFIPVSDIAFANFALSFANHSIRSPLVKALGVVNVDPALTINGETESGISFRTNIGPTSRLQMVETLKNSPMFNTVRDNSTDELILNRVAAWIAEANFWYDTDHFLANVPRADIRSTIDKLLNSIDSQYQSVIDFYALAK